MSGVGNISGDLILRIGSEDLLVGHVSIPLKVRTSTRQHSGDEEVSLSIGVDLERFRNDVAAIFAGSAQ